LRKLSAPTSALSTTRFELKTRIKRSRSKIALLGFAAGGVPMTGGRNGARIAKRLLGAPLGK
jgi:hypothetical protein